MILPPLVLPTAHTISECDIALTTISFDITGVLPATELRVEFADRNENVDGYLVVVEVGHVQMSVLDAVTSEWQPMNIDAIASIHFQVAASEALPVDFDFCISNLQLE